MGEALVAGLLDAKWCRPDELAVVEKVEPRRKELGDRFPGVQFAAEPVEAEAAVIAVKPPDVAEACSVVTASGASRALSIAAGVTIARLEAWLGGAIAVVRAMPNTPALVGAGAAAIAPGTRAEEDDLAWAENLLRAVGIVVRVPERLLDAVTGLSGSGPAYVYLVAEALIDAGVAVGLPRPASTALATQTILGAGRLLVESGDTPEVLRAAVTTPGGTTAAGLGALEARAMRAAFAEAVAAATARARELGDSGTPTQ
jgi:pyrroline-5-carboxylate reductase